ncbi:uncharacterized protein DFE_0682 [Desulfovibrio ferrophilus]|uniref:Uncharacterized protein n=1 Tax=Desulfovibrio ferrophilus TaxID=241368 RepID=A0A2Z6AW14_9BACT|nr:uncharacterized protein DFE_0682 [Desulfovibrio ferrophilus]
MVGLYSFERLQAASRYREAACFFVNAEECMEVYCTETISDVARQKEQKNAGKRHQTFCAAAWAEAQAQWRL